MSELNLLEIGRDLGVKFVPFLFALCFHEYAHGFVARLRGDRTAEMAGRLTMNPMAHADPLGTWILPILAIVFKSGFFFGWAQPVPVNSRNLKNAKYDMFWVSLAGPMSNVLLVVVAVFLLGFVYAKVPAPGGGAALTEILQYFIRINLFLAFFNLIPIHPLDGGKIVEPFLPIRWNMWMRENQSQLNMFLMLFLFVAGPILALPVLLVEAGAQNLAIHLAQIMA
jgi:Zn-dependent protease